MTETMLAAVYRRYGGPEVVGLERVATPKIGDGDVLVKVALTTVNSGDSRMRAMRMPGGFKAIGPLALGVFRPRKPILGSEFAGEVIRVGAKVKRFKTGDHVYGGDDSLGCHAEFKAVAETGCIATVPANLKPLDVVPATFGGNTALAFLDEAKLKPGDKILVVGASGAVGSAAVQIARILGAEVTGVCSARNVDHVRRWGAARAIDYGKSDYTHEPHRYDVIFDTTGVASLSACKKIMAPGGRLILISGGVRQSLLLPAWTAMRGGPRVISHPVWFSPARFGRVTEWVQAGAFKPFVEKTYPFDKIAAAHAAVDTGHKVGSIAVSIP